MSTELRAGVARSVVLALAALVATTAVLLGPAADAIGLRGGDLILRSSYEAGELPPLACAGPEADSDDDGLVDPACVQVFTPPDPRDVATPIDPTVPVDFDEVTEFLHSGPNPVQRGARREDIAPHRVVVIRGKVMNDQGAPLAGVLVRALDQPEVGYTYTRSDGIYDLAVNGGGEVVVDYQRSGFLRAQRRVDAPWRDWQWAADVRMVALDPAATTVSLGPAAPQQVVQGSTMVDADGSRRVALIIPPGTRAELVFNDGSRVPASSLTVRATEYTVGPSGPERLPGSLPASSQYTYAVELSADEAIASGAKSVEFSAPIAAYLENFLSFPVGVHIPVGSYRFRYGQWLPEPDGRVVRVLSTAGGVAQLDVDGNGIQATDAEYAALGISSFERTRLATLYPAGSELWRFQVLHFTPWDCNFPAIPNDGDEPPREPLDEDPDDGSDDPDGDPCSGNPTPDCSAGDDQGDEDSQDEELGDENCEPGSVIGCESGSLRKRVALPGTDLSLIFDSRLVPARLERVVAQRVRVTGRSVPPRLLRADVLVSHLGNLETRSIASPQPNHFESFAPGIGDAYGRPWTTPGRITATLRYHYPIRFAATTTGLGEAWSRFGDTTRFTFSRDFEDRTYSIAATVQSTRTPVFRRDRVRAGWNARGQGFGGWTIQGHHVLDSEVARLFGGGAAGRSAVASSITEISTSQLLLQDFSRDEIRGARRLAVAPDGALFLLANNFWGGAIKGQPGQNAIWRYTVDGRRELWADFCTGTYGVSCLDEIGASIPEVIRDITVDARGRPVVTDGRRILRFNAPEASEVLFDGGAFPQACSPMRLAASTQRVFFACTAEGWIGAIWSEGQVSRIAGGGSQEDDGTPAERIALNAPRELALDAQENLFVYDAAEPKLWKIQTNGFAKKVAGTGASGFTPDGEIAVGGSIGSLTSLLATSDGRVVFADATASRLREIDASGRLRSLAGGGDRSTASIELGVIARQLNFDATDFDALPDGTVVHVSSDGPESDSTIAGLASSSFASFRGYRGSPGTIAVPESDGASFHVFDERGRHLETRRSDTGSLIRRFEYNADGYLTSIVDAFNARTTVQRGSANRPLSITSPDGLVTTLALDAHGNLASIGLPENEEWVIEARSDGLLDRVRAPNGGTTTFQWFRGELAQHEDSVGGLRGLGRVDWRSLGTVRRSVTSPLGRERLNTIDRRRDGSIARVERRPGQMGHSIVETALGTRETLYEDGVRIIETFAPDDRFGLPALHPISRRTTIPGVGERRESHSRTVTPIVPEAAFGQLDVLEVRSINSRIYSSEYSSADRRYRHLSPEGREVQVDLTSAGRIARVAMQGIAPIEYTYDARGRPSTAARGEGPNRRTTTFTYDTNGYLHTVRDPLDRVTTLTNDRLGRTTSLRTPDLRTIGYRYRAGGQVAGISPSGRPEHQFQWTLLDQLRAYEPPALAGVARVDTRLAYDADRQLTHVDRPDGLVVDLGYDAVSGLLTSLQDGLTDVTLDRDLLGRVVRSEVPSWTLTRSWRGAGLPESEGQGEQGTISWEFDTNFWLTRMSFAGSGTARFRTDYAYDRDGLLVGARLFDAPGNLVSFVRVLRRFDNGLLSGTEVGDFSDSWTYNEFAEPARYAAVASSESVYVADYTRDKLGRIVSVVEQIGSVTRERGYRYDLAGRLEQVTVDGVPAARYTFDPNSNRTRVTYGDGASAVVVDATFDAQDRLLTYGDYRYTWTANGDLATRTHVPANTTLTTIYDSFGNLKQASLPDGRVLDYTTDGRHRRVQKLINGAVVEQYLYLNQLEPIAVLDSSGAIVASFVYADRPHTPSLMHKGGRTYRLVADHVGSVRLVVDVADGMIAQRIDYDEYGRVLADTNPGFQPFGFAGGLYDRDTGFVRFGARDYDPMTGRWTAKDPAGFDGGENFYVYGDGDPVNMIDITGEVAFLAAPPLMGYARCLASCVALEGVISAVTSDCGIDLPSLTADCATSCFNPLNWFRIDRAIRASDRGWDAARRAYWKEHGPGGKPPTRDVVVRDNKSGRIYQRTETKELHHVEPRRSNGSHSPQNLREVWPTEHGSIDPYRHPGYTVIRVL